MVIRTFNCTILQLYAICRLGWQSCLQSIDDFVAFKLKYTPEYVNERLAEVEAAANLPDDQARTSNTETYRLELIDLNTQVMDNWQALKRYIIERWEEQQKPKLEAAGQNYYEAAGQKNWEATTGLLKSGSLFLSENLTELTANLNMPPAFEAKFNGSKTAFEKKLAQFLDSQETATIGTDDKAILNNELHAKIMNMFEDGQQIFKNKDAIKRQFVFETVLGLISGPGTAGLRGTVTNAVKGNAIANATITIETSGKFTTTDEEGKYTLTQLASGTYKIIISAEGYETKEIAAQEIKVGTISTLNITLTPIT